MRRFLKWWFLGNILILISQSVLSKSDEIYRSKELSDIRKKSISIFPILMYDSDIGFGLGGKGVVKNLYRKNESFDLILFGSTKGEQWYVFTFSIPDFEIRQGTQYPICFDFKINYDKFLKSNFFGFGNNSKDNDWQFPKEFSKLEVTFGRAFTERIIGEIGLFFNHTSVYDYKTNQKMSADIPGAGEKLTSYIKIHWRRDTRDSRIHPKAGWNLGLNADFASKSLGGDYNFNRYRLEISKYQKLLSPDHIFAFRCWSQHIDGTAPFYEQSIIGGGGTARGFKADRFIGNAFVLVSAEYRFMIYKKLGGILLVDYGRVFNDINKANLHNWKSNGGWGLRYYTANFVVRFDMGISKEGTRIFFNFGHVF